MYILYLFRISDIQIYDISAISEEVLLVGLTNSIGTPIILIPLASGVPIFPLLPEFICHAEPVFIFVNGTARQYLPIQIVEPKVNKYLFGIHK